MKPQEIARRLRPIIERVVVSLSDTDALKAVELFPKWEPDVDYEANIRLRYEGTLYKVRQAHTSQSVWTPDLAPALYAEVENPGQGDTPDNPIPYNNNMELVEGKYYEQYDVVYVCIRSTGVPVYNDLKDLVNIYVAIYEA